MENACENTSRKRLTNGIKYKKMLESWTRVAQVGADSPREGVELSKGCVSATDYNGCTEEDEERKTPSNVVLESPFEGPTGVKCQIENAVDKLRWCWSKRQNAVVFDNEERFAKVVLWILSLKNSNLPFLIVAPASSLSAWETEFSRHESSNIVVYKGKKDVRSGIRSSEFYNEYGCLMFQVLLTFPGIVTEDLRILEGIKWGGIIADECQRPIIYRPLNQMKDLSTEMRLLIFNDHIKESRRMYKSLLSFISCGVDEEKENDPNSDDSESNDNVFMLKEQLACAVAYECEHQAPGVLEYWVSVRLSNVQLEQYCASLLSKSMFLCSFLRMGSSESLHELLLLERKCCDQPYLVDLGHSLRRSIAKDLSMVERLNGEKEMSGKLQLFDKCLLHIKEKNLREFIIFQPFVGPRTISTGVVLEDFVLQRFGKDSYVCISGKNVLPSKKQAALKLFNDGTNSG